MELLHSLQKYLPKINEWLDYKQAKLEPNVYISADIRNNGKKIAPVDINFFPACFNNLSHESCAKAAISFDEFFSNIKAYNILLIPENYTRNKMYLSNVLAIQKIINMSSLHCVIGSVSVSEDVVIPLNEGEKITIHAMKENGKFLYKNIMQIPDAVLLNTDLTSGTIDLSNIFNHKIFPEQLLGWHNREKSKSFSIYNNICMDFAKEFDFDPWFLSTIFVKCHGISFKKSINIDFLAEKVNQTIASISEAYKRHSITDKPTVFVKANHGSHGLGILVAKSGDDVLSLNKKIRNNMHKIKHQSVVDSVVIQEGIATNEFYNGAPKEYIAVLVCGKIITFVARINKKKGINENLNQIGAFFQDSSKKIEDPMYNIVARLVAISAANERQMILQKNI